MNLERIGPYRILRLIGKGGMGAVYEGLHEAIERRVAIKVLHPELGRRADMATRFINEARAVNRIDHPGLVQVSDFGQLPDGMAYIVMEFLKGENLGQRLKRLETRLPTADVIRLGRQMGSALAAAHDKEIVHRDLKPDNVMIVPNADVPGGEQIKVLDFGIAKIAEVQSGISEAHTRADALLGTPRYMSPEQCKGSGTVDAKSDVYSLGVIFYEALSGKPPFPGSAHGELIVQHMMQEPPPLMPLVDPSAPEQLVQLVHLMLRKDKESRPTMRQVVAELDKLGGYMSGLFGVGAIPSGLSLPGVTNPSYPGGPPSQKSLPGITGPQTPPPIFGSGALPIMSPVPVPGSSTLGAAAGQAPARPRWAVAVAAGSIAGALFVGLMLIMTLKPPAPPPPLPPPPVAHPVKPVEPAAPKQVHSALDTQPSGATVVRVRDGQVLGTTPLSLKNPMGGNEKLRIVLPGYREEALTLDLSQDSELQIELRRRSGRDKSKGSQKGYVHGDLTVVD